MWEEWLRSSYPLVKLVGWGEHLPSQVPVDDKTSLCLLQSSHSNDNKYQVFELSCISRITVRGQQGFAVTLNHNPTDGAQVSKFCNLIYANNIPLSLERSLLFLALHTASLSSLYLPLLVCPYLARKKKQMSKFPRYIPLDRVLFNSVESNPALHWFCFIWLCDWSRKLVPLSQPIGRKTKTNHDLVDAFSQRQHGADMEHLLTIRSFLGRLLFLYFSWLPCLIHYWYCKKK